MIRSIAEAAATPARVPSSAPTERARPAAKPYRCVGPVRLAFAPTWPAIPPTAEGAIRHAMPALHAWVVRASRVALERVAQSAVPPASTSVVTIATAARVGAPAEQASHAPT